jgi:O-antigen ligase
LMAPRGSREGLRARIGESGQGGLIVLLLGLVVISAVLVGLLAGPILCVPFAVALLVVGLPSAWPTGLRWTSVGLTALSLLALGCGALIADVWARIPGARPPTLPEGIAIARTVWTDAWRITADFPIFGSGLGSFGSIYPYYKTQDPSQTTALSSLIQWWVESGAMGMGLLVIGIVWCLIRMPGAIRRVGSADRSLVFGLIGAAVGFTLYSALHWTVELAAVALAASALGGIWNRWLAGGTDLFVERG